MMRQSRLAKDFNITNKWHPASWVPHFLHRDKAHRVTQYTPTDAHREEADKRGILWAYLQLWHFPGNIIGDDRKMDETNEVNESKENQEPPKDIVLKPEDVVVEIK
jgi:hypothetical protein